MSAKKKEDAYFEKRVKDLFQFLSNIAKGMWLYGSGIKTVTNETVNKFIMAELKIIGIMLAIMLAGFILKIQGLVVFGGMIASIAMISAWMASDAVITAISQMAKIIPDKKLLIPIKDGMIGLSEALKKLLAPLVTISMFLAFIAAVAALRGTHFFTLHNFMVWGTVILFASVFAVYVGFTTKIPGWLMFGYVIYLLAKCYLFPIPAISAMNSVESFFTNWSLVSNYENIGREEIKIPAGTTFYESRFGKFVPVGTAKGASKAKVISSEEDSVSGEILYKAIFSIDENSTNYIGGSVYYVPVSSVKPKIMGSASGQGSRAMTPEERLLAEVNRLAETMGSPEVAELNEVNNWKFVAHVNDGDIIHYLSLKSFIRKGEKNKTRWEPAISQKTHYTFYNNTDSDIWFGKNKENTKVYYWVEKK